MDKNTKDRHSDISSNSNDWKNDRDSSLMSAADKKVLFMVIGVAAMVILILIIVLAVFIKNKSEERAKLQAQLSMQQEELQNRLDETNQDPENEQDTEDISKTTEASDEVRSDSADSGELTGNGAAQSKDLNVSAGVGALDDEQDPQESAAAGNEGSGAEVTVAGINEDEVSGMVMGIDVSKYQGTIDWDRVKNSGVGFAMIRVGYRAKATGELFEDPTARYNMQEAQKAGVMIGAYFFSSAVTPQEAKAEAVFTEDIIAKYKITYPVAYNCEDFQSPDSRQFGLDRAARTSLACAFLDEIASAGYTPMFYASKGELEGSAQWDTSLLETKYKMWVAQYPERPYPETSVCGYSGLHDMWQYTSQGIVDGINKKTDVNIAYFQYTQEAQAKDDVPAETVEADPEVGIIFTEVNETVTAKQETNLRSEPSTLNDDTIMYKLTHGETATRTGIGHNGWSRVIYNGQTLYAVTSYLTTDMDDTGQQAPPQGPVYTPVNEQVTAKIETNLRSEPSTSNPDTVVGMLHNGETLTRTGIGDNGWSQLEYNGQTVYAVSSYLVVQ